MLGSSRGLLETYSIIFLAHGTMHGLKDVAELEQIKA
jgi:hypothetical protein